MGVRDGWVPGGSVELSAAWWRAAVALLAGAALLVAGIALLAVGTTGWQVIDSGTSGNVLTRAFAVIVGGACACGAVLMAARAGGVRTRARVVVSDKGVELVAPGAPEDPVRVPWAAIEAITIEGGAAGGGPASVLPARARLLITLCSRSTPGALRLPGSEPGRITYRLDGFDVPAVRRTVHGFALRCHHPTT